MGDIIIKMESNGFLILPFYQLRGNEIIKEEMPLQTTSPFNILSYISPI